MSPDEEREPAVRLLPPATAEQLLFAGILRVGSALGLAALVVAFVLYATDLVPPLVAIDRLPWYWSLPSDRYLATTGTPGGWGWLALLGHGDVLTLVGIAVLALLAPACYAAILPGLVRRGERVYAAIVAAELVILLAAASGWLAGPN